MNSQLPLSRASAEKGTQNAKLLPPELTSDLVRSETLIAQLQQAVQTKRLTLLSAPAGAGKTTAVLALKRAHHDLRMVWASLDSGDQDAAAFAALIVTVVRQVQPAFGAQTQALLNASGGQGLSPIQLASTLSNDFLALAPETLVLVLDDLHRVDSTAVYELLDHLLERALEDLHLVVTSRHDPPMRLAQLRLRGHLAEFRQKDLQLTETQIAELVTSVARYALLADELALVNERTQGWVAGVKLVALSLSQLTGDAQRADLFNKLNASQRLLFDYLVEEVLDAAQPHERDFLLQTSLLDRLTAQACDAITGRTDSAIQLRSLYSKNYFLTRTEIEDEETETYSYHPLFAQFLQKQLNNSGEWNLAELHCRAAAVATTPEQRIEHWLAAQAWDQAIPAIIELGQKQCERNYVTPQVIKYVERVPAEVRAGHYWLDLIEANHARQKGHQQSCVSLSLAALPRAKAAGDTLGVLEATWNMHFFDEKKVWSGRVEEAMAEHKDVSQARQAHYLIGNMWGYLNEYQWSGTEQYLARYLEVVRQANSPDLYYAAAQHIGPQMLFVDGGMAALAQFDHQALSLAGEGSGLLQAGPYIRKGWSAFLQSDLDTAEQYAQRAATITHSIGRFAYIDMMLDYLLLNIMLARGDYAEVQKFVVKEETRLHTVETHRGGLPGYLFSLWRAGWLQDQLQPAITARLIASLQNAEWTLSTCEPLVLGWQAFGEKKYIESEQLLAEAAVRHRRARWVGTWGNAELDLALFYLWRGENAKALTTWERASTSMRQRGMPGEALMNGHKILPLLELAQEKGVNADLASAALAAFGVPAELGPIPLAQTGQTLTRREAEALQLLVQGASNQEIADKLVITLRTAKAHVSSILSKLQVSTRSEAIARCHEWGLLPTSTLY